MKDRTWEDHYTQRRAEVLYPDENLVRLLKKNLPPLPQFSLLAALDLGCGSGRHLKLLSDLGIKSFIGLDSSLNALLLSKKHSNCPLVLADNRHIPLKDNSVGIVIAWGSLHYSIKKDLPLMLGEILRILAPDGQVFATLRSSRDTYLKKGRHLGNNTWMTDLSDITGSIVSFYDEDELAGAFSLFRKFTYGHMERTLMGDTAALISHWVVHAVK